MKTLNFGGKVMEGDFFKLSMWVEQIQIDFKT